MGARNGSYGAPAFDPDARMADVLMQAIEREMGQMTCFTREDLLHTSAFSHVATITRYRYVSEAVTSLLERRQLVAFTRTTLGLPKRRSAWRSAEKLLDRHRSTIEGMAIAFCHGGDTVSVLDILDAWEANDELSRDTKRVVVRRTLSQLARDGVLTAAVEPGSYRAAEGEG